MGEEGSEIDTENFDDVLEGLRAVVSHLENGNLGLKDALAAYEKGVGLAGAGHRLLEQAEKRIELLVASSKEEPSTEPFQPVQHTPESL